VASESGNNGAFQYILNACTSIATKVNEPSITYLNQGQAYELTLKKMTEFPLMTSQRKRLIKCQIRICFHERRLQYMELEQVIRDLKQDLLLLYLKTRPICYVLFLVHCLSSVHAREKNQSEPLKRLALSMHLMSWP
jgi:hypothetical protein